MTANVLEHRRAKAFAEALEAHRTGQPAASAALGQLLGTTEALAQLAAPAMDAGVKSEQRAQLMAAFEQHAAGGLPTVPRQRRHRSERGLQRRRWGRRFAITGLVAGVTVGSFAGVAAASSGALPGDPLYGMKRGLEGLRLDLAGSDAERGALLLDQASTRLAEARSLVGRQATGGALSQTTVAQLASALKDMHAEAAKGRDLLRSVYRANGSLDPMRKLASFTEAQDNHWSALQQRLPQQLTPVAGQVDQLFDNLNEDVAPLHLEPAQSAPASGQTPATGPVGGAAQAPSPAGAASGGGHPSTGSAPQSPAGGQTGGGQPTTGGGTAQSPGGGQARQGGALGGGNPVGGLVNGLTGSLTGSGAGAAPATPASPGAAPSTPTPGTTPAPAAPTAAVPGQGGSTPATGQGLNLPPLIPGLLPGLGLDGS